MIKTLDAVECCGVVTTKIDRIQMPAFCVIEQGTLNTRSSFGELEPRMLISKDDTKNLISQPGELRILLLLIIIYFCIGHDTSHKHAGSMLGIFM